jgi:hypothetical protein
MNFKAFISVNIHTVALSWSSREREHPAPAARSMLHLVWDTLYIQEIGIFNLFEAKRERIDFDLLVF